MKYGIGIYHVDEECTMCNGDVQYGIGLCYMNCVIWNISWLWTSELVMTDCLNHHCTVIKSHLIRALFSVRYTSDTQSIETNLKAYVIPVRVWGPHK